MKTKTFNSLRDLIYDRSGIALGDNKEALVRARIGKHMRELGIDDYDAYLHHVIEDTSGRELQMLLDFISTNVTDFYRESKHFVVFREHLTAAIADGHKRLRIWSAACSSGEEPYTIAIESLETLGGADVDLKILASDISVRMLKRCQEGVYNAARVAPVPKHLRTRYFSKRKDGKNIYFEVNEHLKSLLTLRRINLIEFPYTLRGPLDVIFCRNVMIYFDTPIRMKIVQEFKRLLRPGGLLFLGHAETLNSMSAGFRSLGPSVYRRDK